MKYKYYLATTAMSEIWDRSSSLLFLGPWCFTDIKVSSLKNKRIVPSPWYPVKTRKQAFDYCYSLYNMTIVDLQKKLNHLHGVSYEDKYWRILIGPWLFHYIMILFDRYKRLEKALESFPYFYTYVFPQEKCSLVSYSMDDFLFGNFGKVKSDFYNHLLYSIIAHEICPENIIEKDFKYEVDVNVIKRSLKRRVFNFFKGFLKDKAFKGHILLNEMYHMTLHELLILNLKIGINRMNFVEMTDFAPPYSVSLKDSYSHEMREALKICLTGDRFKSILFKTIPTAIPICYIEDYEYHKRKIKTFSNLSFSGSAVGWIYNERFKLCSAELLLKSTTLAEFQHGGGYGFSLFSPMESLALEKDIFYSWGWTDKQSKKIKPLPSPYLSRLMNTNTGIINKILIIGTTLMKYEYRIDVALISDDIERYFHDKRKFLKALKETFRHRILYRPGNAVGLKETEYIKSLYPSVEIVNKKSLIYWMRKARLAVIDHPHTSFLEALTINIPTVLFWDHDIYSFRKEAEPFFESLKDVGILYDNSENAAKMVNKVFEDPKKWWQSDNVQNVRKQFCNRFAYARKDWLDIWAREFDNLPAKIYP